MLTLVVVTAGPAVAPTLAPRTLPETIRQRDVVVVVPDVQLCGTVFSDLKAQLPRFHFVPLLVNDPDHINTALLRRLVVDGDVPLLACPEPFAQPVAETLRRELRPNTVLRMPVGPLGRPADPSTIPITRSALRSTGYLHAVPGGWCSRAPGTACLRTAAAGCYSCPHLDVPPQLTAVHADTGRRAAQLLDGANGNTQTAILNQQIIENIGTLLHEHRPPGPAPGPDAAADAP
jgi:hypothetical protein